MARGFPDFGRSIGTTAEGKFLQLLSKPSVWFEDNFDNPTYKWQSGPGTINLLAMQGTVANLSYVYSGYGCLKMEAAAGSITQITRVIPQLPIINHVGLEVLFYLHLKVRYKDIEDSIQLLYLTWEDGTTKYNVRCCYNPTDNKFYISEDNAATWINIATINLRRETHHYFKLIFDPVNNKYKTLIVNGIVIDISSYNVYSVASADGVRSYLWLGIKAVASSFAFIAINNVKITYGES